MSETNKCLYCKITSQEVPLIKLDFKGQELFVCPQHIPLLIHEPQKLIGKLPGAERMVPYQQD
ncbi:MAG: hypothetical protein GYA48_16810 [Chloroflexi bacterium]|nr:hypothetical protein [Chloroflexota bacterium]